MRVYLTHTGAPTWSQRSWAAILYAGRSALHVESALHQPSRDTPPAGPIHVAVDWSRRVTPRPGIVVHRVRGLDDLARGWVTPRLRYRQVFATPCRTASRLAVLFRARGWKGELRPCGRPGCEEWGSSS